ncbi:MAG: hypothetical protein N7Q72_03560 [Spiroplasma sp. Tabriz.8]|nr:hypothetical protein [Spiroplasma sp. Tabriz.8]
MHWTLVPFWFLFIYLFIYLFSFRIKKGKLLDESLQQASFCYVFLFRH